MCACVCFFSRHAYTTRYVFTPHTIFCSSSQTNLTINLTIISSRDFPNMIKPETVMIQLRILSFLSKKKYNFTINNSKFLCSTLLVRCGVVSPTLSIIPRILCWGLQNYIVAITMHHLSSSFYP